MDKLKTRFAPSPTGLLHVGGARTALFSYALARKSGGTFLLRIEDTDRKRHQEHSVALIMEDLRWLGIEWDEGVGVGGPNGPYRQSERLDIYKAYVQQLLDTGKAYYAFETNEELEATRESEAAEKKSFKYKRPSPLPTAADAEKVRAAGQPVVVRFLCPSGDVTIHDDAFGDVTVPADQMDDFILLKDDGYPIYHTANVIDDALMGVDYIVRGQEFLAQTWRHVLLRRAWGFAEPRGYCHLPLIMDMKGQKLSKRDGDVEVASFRRAGYLPEAMVNFVALLGWNPGNDREKFTLAEMIELFSTDRIGKANAKFDRTKLLAFNTDAIAAASEDRKLAALKDYLSLNETPIPTGDDELLRRLVRANTSIRTFADIPAKCSVLFVTDDAYEFDAEAVAKVLAKGENGGFGVLEQLRPLLGESAWDTAALETLLEGFCAKGGLGMGKVAQPLRVAVTGTTISPAIYDTLLILGKDKTLARIDRCLKVKK